MTGPKNNLSKSAGRGQQTAADTKGGPGATDPASAEAKAPAQVGGVGGKIDTSAQDAKNAEQARLRDLEQKQSAERRELLVGVTQRLHAWLSGKIKAHGELVKASQGAIAEAQQAERRLRRASQGADHQAFMDAANAAMAIVDPPTAKPAE